MDSKKKVDDYAKGFPIASLTFEGSIMKYGVPNNASLWRVSTFETKEPETIKWISGFKEGEVFFDVGANMGLYTIFAAVHRRVKVFAFEPESQNYALLNRNIRLNNLSNNVVAWCCALSNDFIIDRLYMRGLDVAQSGHAFGAEVDTALRPKKALFAQGSISHKIDSLIESGSIPVPNHVKIDVDGIEHLVIEGASETFADKKLKSVLIEISPHIPEHLKIVSIMRSLGFIFDSDQVERAKRKEGSTKDYAEYIFRR